MVCADRRAALSLDDSKSIHQSIRGRIVGVAGVRQHPAVSQLLAIAMPFKPNQLPPAADIWERYSYNPITGQLFSRLHPRRKALGAYDRAGYLQTKIEWYGERTLNVMMHRLIYKWCHGAEPGMTIDHIDQTRDNNRIWNLRIADMMMQRRNRRDSVHLRKARTT